MFGCDEYQRLEKQYLCGEEGYIDFAHKRCQHYAAKSAASRLSKLGKYFISNVKSCLIEELTKKKLDCSKLWPESVQEHVDCFEKNNYCDLSFADQVEISLITGVPNKRLDIFLSTAFSIGKLCWW